MGEALERQASRCFAARSLTGVLGVVEKAKISRPGALERRNPGDPSIERGAWPRLGPS